jgi:hypothetical protein
VPKPGTVPAGHDCNACRFAGRQKYGEDVCFLSGNTCRRFIEGGNVQLSPRAREIYLLWSACQSQWRVGFGGPTGLDYVAVQLVANALGIEWDAQLLKHLQALEGATLKFFADQQKAAEKKKA